VGETFGKYHLQRRLGAGGMAEVFLAEERGLHGFSRLVVIKRILPDHAMDPHFEEMFINEARVCAHLCHPNVVQTYEFSRHPNGQVYLAMEHVDGITSREWLLRGHLSGGKLPWPAVVTVVRDTLLGLHHAHEARDSAGRALGIVHRDVSPANIIVGKDGRARILDFGIARTDFEWTKTQAGHFKGKPTYIPPEQFTGRPVDRRADVWAAGAVLYELLTGVPLVNGVTAADALQMATAGPGKDLQRRRPDVPTSLATVFLQSVHPHVDGRLPSARAFANALDQLAHDAHVQVGHEVVMTALVPRSPKGDGVARQATRTTLNPADPRLLGPPPWNWDT